jgi:RimJ/RimL family protein N-acetyltransferase
VELGLPIDREVIDANVVRAMGMKLEKMRSLPPEQHPWQTYWLIVLRDNPVGMGLIGFKGYPNAAGETEIGYGLAPVYWGQGYMPEAVRGLCEWAFSHPFVSAVTATTVKNPASNRVLEKVGAQLVSQDETSANWKIYPHSTNKTLTQA